MRKLVSLVLTLCLLVTPLLCGCESPFAYSPEEWFAENPIPSLAEPETNPVGLEIGEDYELPVLSITCDTDYYDVQKGHAVTAKIEISGDARFSGMQYRGEADIKLRGNSTAYQVKRPFKIKLAKKTKLVGMGANIGDGSRNILLRARIAMGRMAIPDDKTVEAFRQKMKGDRLGFAGTQEFIAAAGTDDDCRTAHIQVDLFIDGRHIQVERDLCAIGRGKGYSFTTHDGIPPCLK